jgi:hypothetical protein
MILVSKINIFKPTGMDFIRCKIFTNDIEKVRESIRQRPEYYNENVLIDIRYYEYSEVKETFDIVDIQHVKLDVVSLDYCSRKIERNE